MSKIIAKNISKNLRGKCSQKPLGHAKQSATDAFKTAIKRAIEETAEATGDLICNKIPNNSQQNNSKTVTSEYDRNT